MDMGYNELSRTASFINWLARRNLTDFGAEKQRVERIVDGINELEKDLETLEKEGNKAQYKVH